MPTLSQNLAERFMRAVRAAAWSAIGIAVAVLVCWRFGFYPDAAWLDVRGTKPLTASCIVVLGLAMVLLVEPTPKMLGRAGRWLAAAGAGIGIVSALDYLLPARIGLAPVVASWFTTELVDDPRLAPSTSVAVAVLGVALLLVGTRPTYRQCPGQWLALVPMFLCGVAVIGHSYGIVRFFRVGPYTGMALPTAVSLFLLSLGAVFIRPCNYPAALFSIDNLGGFVARRVIPAAALFPFVAGWLRLKGEQLGYYSVEVGVAMFAAANIVFFTLLVAFVAGKLAVLDKQRKESELLLRGTLEGTEDFIAVLDPEFRWLAFNEAHQREYRAIYGREPRRGESMIETMRVPADAAAAKAIWARALAGEAFRVTQQFGDPRLARKWYEIRFTPIRNAAGQIIAAAQIVRDMTAWLATQETLRQARDEMERSHSQQQAIVQSMAEGVVVFDREGALVDANGAALTILGFDSLPGLRDAVEIGARAFEVRDPEGHVLSIEAWPKTRALRGETFVDYELMVTRRDGSRAIFVGFGGAPVRDRAGQIVLAVVTLRDITKEREAEELLRQARRQLEEHAQGLERVVQERTAKLTESLHEMERFSYSLSHDMRAPLRAMKGFSQMLELEFGEKLNDEGKMYLRRISAAAGRLDQLIQDVLTYSRIVRESIQLEPVDVGQLTRQLIEENPAFQAPAASVAVEGNLVPMMGHVAYLTQVITNLLGNAVKFVTRGEKPRVRIWSERKGDRARLYIEDNGIGIPREAMDKLFGMFQRLNPSYEGTGIGLNIVRKAVERMGGRVGVESEPGRGTTFWVELAAAPP